jgi:hypothetical protein
LLSKKQIKNPVVKYDMVSSLQIGLLLPIIGLATVVVAKKIKQEDE